MDLGVCWPNSVRVVINPQMGRVPEGEPDVQENGCGGAPRWSPRDVRFRCTDRLWWDGHGND